MSCYYPLKGFAIGLTASGKTDYKVTSYDTDHVEIDDAGRSVAAPSAFVSPYARRVVRDWIEIPCGQCIGCRLAYSRQWADRCMLELPYHEQSWFVTLTYDDKNLRLIDSVDPDTGEIGVAATLLKRDVQLFIKRLRKNYKYDNRIKYFCAGEYGSRTYRPHYHIILFGLKLDDLKFYKRSALGYDYFNSDFLTKCWSQGHVVVGRVTWDTCAYTARYIMKKQYGSAAYVYDKYGIQPEFTLMSLKPAIGRCYYEDHKDVIFDFDSLYVGTDTGSYEIKPPRYYSKLLEIDDFDLAMSIRDSRRDFAFDMTRLKLESTSLPYLSMLQSEEENKLAHIRSLSRKDF